VIASTNDTISVFVLGSFIVACSAKVSRFPRQGESLRAEALTVEAGGKGFNLMVGAGRLGVDVDGLLAIGDDAFSQFAPPALARAGLPPHMLRTYRAETGSGIGFIDPSGETCLAIHPGANLLLSGADVRAAADAVKGAKLILAQFEIGDEPIIEAFALARAAGVTTILNPSPFRMPPWEILSNTSIIVVNAVEATALAEGLLAEGIGTEGPNPEGPNPEGLGPEEIGIDRPTGIRAADASAFDRVAAAVFDRGPQLFIVTLGPKGALAFRPGQARLHQAAFAVDAIDTLGAGDAFTAGFAAGLLEERSLSECLRRAAASGALAALRLGVFEALPTRDELEAFLTKMS
jgi:ribokinase